MKPTLWQVIRPARLAAGTVAGLLALVAAGLAQQPAPTPKKDPFAGFGTSLDQRPGKPSASSTSSLGSTPSTNNTGNSAAGGLKLNGRWDSPVSLSRGGPSEQGKELRSLLTDFVEASNNIGPFPGKIIYPPVTYLQPLRDAEAKLGLAGKLAGGGIPNSVGFPDGLKYTEITPEAGRNFTTRFLMDIAEQVVAIEFIALDANALPRPASYPPPPRQHLFQGRRISDFVPQARGLFSSAITQASWDFGDYILISTRGGPKATDFYIPKPMASLILYSLSASQQ